MENISSSRRFISFEGIDFSGKTTQINLLKSYLLKKGYEVSIIREPGGTIISEKIREILLDKKHTNMHDRTELFLYSAARVQLLEEKIIPLLEKGSIVIADRFVDSTTAYQGYGREIDPQIIRQINELATGGILPALTFYLKLEPQQVDERRKNRKEEQDRLEISGDEFYKRVYKGYEEIADYYKERIVTIDAYGSIETIQNKILKIVKDRVL
jgi:dTMP kinase